MHPDGQLQCPGRHGECCSYQKIGAARTHENAESVMKRSSIMMAAEAQSQPRSRAPAPRVLAATDLSELAREAIRQGHLQALAGDGVLGVCHVLPLSGVHELFPAGREATMETFSSELAAEVVSRSVMSLTGRAREAFEVFIEHGMHYAEIVRRAESWRASLVVVGGRRQSGTATALLGSVGEKVVRYAPCSVLVARARSDRGLVIAATDLSSASELAVEVAVSEARRRRAKLMVLYVVDQGLFAGVGPSTGHSPVATSRDQLEETARTACSSIEALLAKLGVGGQVAIVEGHAAPWILRYAAEERPELLVLGTKGRTGLARVVLGSVAERVVREATTSVLAVRLHTS
jgi:nucleotide-binding universal stress UspA family protein